MKLLLLAASLLLGACSYSENGGQHWNRIQLAKAGDRPPGSAPQPR